MEEVVNIPGSPPRRFARWVVIALSLAMVWLFAGNHPIYPPDEARYATVSMLMADGADWIVPQFRGEPHLTKPPLTYWAQAACLRVFGFNEWAIRAPSLIAATLVILLTYWIGRRFFSIRTGVLAAALLVMMPLYLVVGRLASTDSMLNVFWFGALAGGLCAVQTGQRRWAALMWFSVALGLLTKGPIALTPVGVLLIWLALARRWRDMRSLHILAGAPLAIAPVLLWAFAIVKSDPQALSVWSHQTIDRAVGRGDHTEPFWFYAPIFLVGLFPATAVMTTPGLNISWRGAWSVLRSGEVVALLVLSVVVPFVLFTLIAGKLPTYLLPLCAPLALLIGVMLDNRLRPSPTPAPEPTHRVRPPEIAGTLTICVTLAAIAMFVGLRFFKAELVSPARALPFLIVPAACALAWRLWRLPERRSWALAAIWGAWLAACAWAYRIEPSVFPQSNPAAMVRRLQALTGAERPNILTYALQGQALAFYNRRELVRLDDDAELLAAARSDPGAVLLADAVAWEKLIGRAPDVASNFSVAGEWRRWTDKKTLVLRSAVSPPDFTASPDRAPAAHADAAAGSPAQPGVRP